MEDGDEEELEEAEIERFLDPMDCSSDADSSIAVSITAAVTTAVTTAGQKAKADEAAIESKDVAAAKPEGKTRGATAAAAREDSVTVKSADCGKGDKAAAAKDGRKKNQKAGALYPIGTEISKDFDGVGKCIQSEYIAFFQTMPMFDLRSEPIFYFSPNHNNLLPMLPIIHISLSR